MTHEVEDLTNSYKKLTLFLPIGNYLLYVDQEVQLKGWGRKWNWHRKACQKFCKHILVFFAGICNFTKKIKHAHDTEQLFNTFKVHSKRNQFHLVFNYSPQFPLKNSKNINSKGDLCKAVNFLLKTPSLSKYVLRMILEKSF